jgi:hypothetical protein
MTISRRLSRPAGAASLPCFESMKPLDDVFPEIEDPLPTQEQVL